MATITSPRSILEMLENDGVHSQDPQVARIYEYVNAMNGEIMWAVFYKPEHDDMAISFALVYQCLFDRETGLTAAGEAAIIKLRNEMK